MAPGEARAQEKGDRRADASDVGVIITKQIVQITELVVSEKLGVIGKHRRNPSEAYAA